MDIQKTLLLILDGWGIAPHSAGNTVALANTPNLDRIFTCYPHTQLQCSGQDVGLPKGFMGNSEVGHMNIGAGRVVHQEMTRIDMSIENKQLANNQVLLELFNASKAAKGRLHCMGLVSDGGVHSHQNHIYALAALAKQHKVELFIHCFLDGRDTPPTSGLRYIQALQEFLDKQEWGQIATLIGRYWAMDRDKHFERIERAYRAMVSAQGKKIVDPVSGMREAYEAGETDEFVAPCIVDGVDGTVRDNDAVFMFNFRADRARQLCRVWFEEEFEEFARGEHIKLSALATMTRYDTQLPVPATFEPPVIKNTLGEIISQHKLSQLRIAETEKYAHVTYFMNCGQEHPFVGEDRILVPSPRDVATYDLQPEMSAVEVTEKLLAAMDCYDFMICNLANMDMVGHTGIISAVIRAVETVDTCVGRIVKAMLERGGRVLLTADHGNAEEMIDQNAEVQTSHSLNPVPFVLLEQGSEHSILKKGRLADIAPTCLNLLGITVPKEMTGQCLVEDC